MHSQHRGLEHLSSREMQYGTTSATLVCWIVFPQYLYTKVNDEIKMTLGSSPIPVVNFFLHKRGCLGSVIRVNTIHMFNLPLTFCTTLNNLQHSS